MNATQRSVLVSGASSGIGLHLATRLGELGHVVYATARKARDLEQLARLPGVVPIEMDVRLPEQVGRAVQRVREEGLGLYGLVNNAGLGGIGPLTTWTEEELQEIFDVNALAPIRLTKAFLPLLLESKGRIVNIGSQGGSIAMKYFGPYTMTKHALEAFTVALDDELSPAGVRVSIVQPGGIVTAIGENAAAGTIARFRRAAPPFAEEAAAIADAMESPAPTGPDDDAPESANNRKPSSPEIVTVAALDALFSPHPRPRYLVGTRWEGGRVLRMLMQRLLDANDGSSLGYDLEELIEMLREQARLARERAEREAAT